MKNARILAALSLAAIAFAAQPFMIVRVEEVSRQFIHCLLLVD